MTAPQKRHLGIALASLVVALSSQDAGAQSVRPFLTTADGTMSARIDGAPCGDTVRTTFIGKDADAFRSGLETAGRLMNNVTTLLRQQCPSLVRVTTKGIVQSRIVYTGISEAATNWEVVELGAGSGSGLLAGGAGTAASTGGPTPRELFARDAGFAAAPKILDWQRTAPNLCVRMDPKSNTCAALNQFESQGDGSVRMTASYKLDTTGSMAVLVYPAQNKEGFFCSRPADARVSIKDGTLSAAGRTEMQSLLLERVQAAGNEVCTGYSGTAPQALSTESFGDSGVSQTQRTPAALLAQRLPLRLDK